MWPVIGAIGGIGVLLLFVFTLIATFKDSGEEQVLQDAGDPSHLERAAETGFEEARPLEDGGEEQVLQDADDPSQFEQTLETGSEDEDADALKDSGEEQVLQDAGALNQPEQTPETAPDSGRPWFGYAGATLLLLAVVSTTVQFAARSLFAPGAQLAYGESGWSTGGAIALLAAIYMWLKCRTWDDFRAKIGIPIALTVVASFGSVYLMSQNLPSAERGPSVLGSDRSTTKTFDEKRLDCWDDGHEWSDSGRGGLGVCSDGEVIGEADREGLWAEFRETPRLYVRVEDSGTCDYHECKLVRIRSTRGSSCRTGVVAKSRLDSTAGSIWPQVRMTSGPLPPASEVVFDLPVEQNIFDRYSQHSHGSWTSQYDWSCL